MRCDDIDVSLSCLTRTAELARGARFYIRMRWFRRRISATFHARFDVRTLLSNVCRQEDFVLHESPYLTALLDIAGRD